MNELIRAVADQSIVKQFQLYIVLPYSKDEIADRVLNEPVYDAAEGSGDSPPTVQDFLAPSGENTGGFSHSDLRELCYLAALKAVSLLKVVSEPVAEAPSERRGHIRKTIRNQLVFAASLRVARIELANTQVDWPKDSVYPPDSFWYYVSRGTKINGDDADDRQQTIAKNEVFEAIFRSVHKMAQVTMTI